MGRLGGRRRGVFGFADPDTGIGYAYAIDRAGWAAPFDPRDAALRARVGPLHLAHELEGCGSPLSLWPTVGLSWTGVTGAVAVHEVRLLSEASSSKVHVRTAPIQP